MKTIVKVIKKITKIFMIVSAACLLWGVACVAFQAIRNKLNGDENSDSDDYDYEEI